MRSKALSRKRPGDSLESFGFLSPICVGVKFGENTRERGIFPASCNPSRVVKNPQSAKAWNQAPLLIWKFAKLFVARENQIALGLRFLAAISTRQKHPEILHF